jgi:hypothetical protein
MIGKKDTKCIFEQYRNVVKEQVEDSNIKALLNAIKTSSLAPQFKQSLLNLLNDPQVTAKLAISTPVKGGDMDRANKGDSNFAREMAAAQKAQNAAYPEQEIKKFLGEENAEDLGKYNYQTGCYEKESAQACAARGARYKTASNSIANVGRG